MLKKTMLITMIFFLMACGGGSTSSNNNTSRVIDKSKLQFIPPFSVEVEEGQKDAIQLKARGCTNNPTYTISEGDYFKFHCDPETGKVRFEDTPQYEKQNIYTFIAIARGCIDEEAKENITIKIKKNITEDSVVEENGSVENSVSTTPIVTSTPIVTPISESDYFITTWKTETENEQITIPTKGEGYNYTIDWGDGTSDNNVIGDKSHIYNNVGTHIIKIIGDFPRIKFTYPNSKKIFSIEQWGSIKWKSMNYAFNACYNLVGNAIDIPNLSEVTDMRGMFFSANSFNQNINNWDITHITNMSYMFFRALKFNKDISNWDVSNVTDMSSMFRGTDEFNQDISSWNISSVVDMNGMFAGTKAFNQDISNWDVSNIKDMSAMFLETISFQQNINNWNTSNVTNMGGMFSNSTFNQNINNWDVSGVINMEQMFFGANNFNKNIGSWNTSNVTNMSMMFGDTKNFNQNISGWNTSNVTNMEQMFINASSFSNQDLSSWDVSKVTNHCCFTQGWGAGNTEPNWNE